MPEYASFPSQFSFLLLIDKDFATAAKNLGCIHCHGTLHKCDYPRQPRGVPLRDLDDEYQWRFSFCCAVCRRRTTPVSVRFLGRRVYLGIVVTLASALNSGLSGSRIAKLRESLSVSVQTLKRWRKWWLKDFVQTPFWQENRSSFMPTVDASQLPASLLSHFGDADETEIWVRLLRFISPLTINEPAN